MIWSLAGRGIIHYLTVSTNLKIWRARTNVAINLSNVVSLWAQIKHRNSGIRSESAYKIAFLKYLCIEKCL